MSFGRPPLRKARASNKSGAMYTELHETQASVSGQFLRCDKRRKGLEKSLRHSRNKLAKSLVETRSRTTSRRKAPTYNHLGIEIKSNRDENSNKNAKTNHTVRSTAFVVDSFVNYQSMLKTSQAKQEADLLPALNARLTSGGSHSRGRVSDAHQTPSGTDGLGLQPVETAKEKAKAILIRRMRGPLKALRTAILVARAVYRWKALVARRRVLRELEFRETFLPPKVVIARPPQSEQSDGEFYPGPARHNELSPKSPASPRSGGTTFLFPDDGPDTYHYPHTSDRDTRSLGRSITSHGSHLSARTPHGAVSHYPQHQQRPMSSPRIPRPDILARLKASQSQQAAMEKKDQDEALQEKILYERRNPLMTTLAGGLPAKAKTVSVNQVKLAVYTKADHMSPRKQQRTPRRRLSRDLASTTPVRGVQFKTDDEDGDDDAAGGDVRPQTAPTSGRGRVNVSRVSVARRVARADRSWAREERNRRAEDGSEAASPHKPIHLRGALSPRAPLKSALKNPSPRPVAGRLDMS